MTCDFTLDHYREILDAAKKGGYRFAPFEEDPKPKDIFLRHDVDLSLAAAIKMASVEANMDVQATYFLMTRSVFYNLLSQEAVEAIAQLRDLGHWVGLHAVHPHVDADSRFDRVLAWHNPEPDYMREPVAALENVMAERYFQPDRYRSDSNRHWRSGCPHEALEKGEFEWLQLLTHPEIWVFDGETMRETMESMLEAERARGLERLAADRIDLT